MKFLVSFFFYCTKIKTNFSFFLYVILAISTLIKFDALSSERSSESMRGFFVFYYPFKIGCNFSGNQKWQYT